MPLFPDVTLGMMSWKAHETLQRTLTSYQQAGILDLFGAKIIHFNEISEADRRVAARYGFEVSGSAENTGIFGGMDALARATRTPFLLSLENDCPVIVGRDECAGMLASALADMRDGSVPVFQMRSRREPGEKFSRRLRYESKFRVVWPLGSAPEQRRSMTNPVQRAYENVRRSGLRGCALYAEENPSLRHPGVIKRSVNGNWVTSSAYLNWSNNCVLVRTDFLRDVVLARVRTHPSSVTVNGLQDIEAALKGGNWWRTQGIAMGQSEPGAFTHCRRGGDSGATVTENAGRVVEGG